MFTKWIFRQRKIIVRNGFILLFSKLPHRNICPCCAQKYMLLSYYLGQSWQNYSRNYSNSTDHSLWGSLWIFQMLPTMPYNLLWVAFHWCQCASKFGSSFGAAEATPKQRTVRKNEGFMFQKPKKEKEINKYLMRPILKQKKSLLLRCYSHYSGLRTFKWSSQIFMKGL